ncbi:MAG: DUF975 family protein [Minisyncoccia bacterium]
MKTNKILMAESREALVGKWQTAVLTALVYVVIMIAVSAIPKAGSLIKFIISGPFVLGLAIFWLNLSRKNNVKMEMMFSGFNDFGKALGLYALMVLFIFLWFLLLIIPGIMAALSYSMAFFIMADNKEIGVREALKQSKKIMYGNKWKFFCLCLRFIGWALLSILTLGIGFLWLIPYMSVAHAKFYDDIKNAKPEAATDPK